MCDIDSGEKEVSEMHRVRTQISITDLEDERATDQGVKTSSAM